MTDRPVYCEYCGEDLNEYLCPDCADLDKDPLEERLNASIHLTECEEKGVKV